MTSPHADDCLMKALVGIGRGDLISYLTDEVDDGEGNEPVFKESVDNSHTIYVDKVEDSHDVSGK